jgi:Protein of unknown function (DUF3102)
MAEQSEPEQIEQPEQTVDQTDQIDQSLAPVGQEINALHREALECGAKALSIAIQIGKQLAEVKQTVGYFAWTHWMADNLEFSERTARNYMRLAKFETYLLEERVQSLNEAYTKLCPPKVRQSAEKVSHLTEEQSEWLEGMAEDFYDDIREEIADHAEEALGFAINELKTLCKNEGREKVVSTEPSSAGL